MSDRYDNRGLKPIGRLAVTVTVESRGGFSPAPGRGRKYPVPADSDLGFSHCHQTKDRDQAVSCSLASFVARCAKRRFGAVTPEVGIGGTNRSEMKLERERAKCSGGLHNRVALDCGNPLRRAMGAEPLSEAGPPYWAHNPRRISGPRCGRNRPQRWEPTRGTRLQRSDWTSSRRTGHSHSKKNENGKSVSSA